MSAALARELTLQWRAGALRPEEARELQALLLDGGVLEAAERPKLEARAVIAGAAEYHPLDARHTIALESYAVAVVSESWHDETGAETKRFEVRVPLVDLVHVVLNSTRAEREAISARVDWRGVDE